MSLTAVDKNREEISEGDTVYYNDDGEHTGDVTNIFEENGIWFVDLLPHHELNYFRCEAREVEIAL